MRSPLRASTAPWFGSGLTCVRIREYPRQTVVQSCVNNAASKSRDKAEKPRRARAVEQGASPAFSFGSRRFASRGVRRLFVPQKCLMSPVFEPDVERPRALLRRPLPPAQG